MVMLGLHSLIHPSQTYCIPHATSLTLGLARSSAPPLPPGPRPVPTANGGYLQNITVYRITPRNVTDLCEKDAADVAGDYEFYMEVLAGTYRPRRFILSPISCVLYL